MSSVKIERELCKGCELCVHFCPKKCLKMEDGFNSKGYKVSQFVDDENRCSGCAVCARICPDVAIEVWR